MKSLTAAPDAASRRSDRPRLGLGKVVVLVATMALAGCLTRGRDDPLVYEPPRPAAELYNEGLGFMEANNYGSAVDSFSELSQYYPYSDLARRAMVLTAFADYKIGAYDAAIGAAERYLTLYPSSEDAPYALYIKAQSLGAQIPDVTRDQQNTERTISTLQLLIAQFPNSEYAAQARIDLIEVLDQVAGQEMQIGRYYQERREYVAAINRFRTVVTDYQTTSHIEEALFRLTELYLTIGLTSEAQTAAAVLGHNYPNGTWYQNAFNLLANAGIVPAENTQSWISQALR